MGGSAGFWISISTLHTWQIAIAHKQLFMGQPSRNISNGKVQLTVQYTSSPSLPIAAKLKSLPVSRVSIPRVEDSRQAASVCFKLRDKLFISKSVG